MNNNYTTYVCILKNPDHTVEGYNITVLRNLPQSMRIKSGKYKDHEIVWKEECTCRAEAHCTKTIIYGWETPKIERLIKLKLRYLLD